METTKNKAKDIIITVIVGIIAAVISVLLLIWFDNFLVDFISSKGLRGNHEESICRWLAIIGLSTMIGFPIQWFGENTWVSGLIAAVLTLIASLIFTSIVWELTVFFSLLSALFAFLIAIGIRGVHI